mgnify:CR=1 FL=1
MNLRELKFYRENLNKENVDAYNRDELEKEDDKHTYTEIIQLFDESVRDCVYCALESLLEKYAEGYYVVESEYMKDLIVDTNAYTSDAFKTAVLSKMRELTASLQ